MTEGKIPPPVSDAEKFMAHNNVSAIRVIYYQTGTDTSDTDVELTTTEGKKVRWKQSTFNSVADLRMDWLRVCQPKHGVQERVEAREKYEKSNKAELTTYERLKKKYG